MKRRVTYLCLFICLMIGTILHGENSTNKHNFTVDCDAVAVSVNGNTITVNGLNAAQNIVQYLGEGTSFQTVTACDDCPATVDINDLAPGYYEIKVQQLGGGYCFRSFPRVEVVAGGGNTGGDDCNASAGQISTDGPTSICIDGVSTPLNFSVTPGGIGSNRGWIITDDQRNILALPAAPPFDLEGAGVGTCLIYYIRYEDGLQGLSVGQNLGNLSGCFDLSNRIAINRQAPGGGRVTTQDGQTEVTVCAGNAFVPVTRQTQADILSYWYIVTDDNDNILDFLNPGSASPTDDVTLDLSAAPPGVCRIWGWSYRGLGDPIRGQNISTLTDDPCEAISNNFVTVNRVTTGAVCDDDGGGNTGGVNCDGVMASVSNGVIIVTNLNAERNTIEVQGPSTGYVPRLICRDNCGSRVEIPGLPVGEYTVKIQQSGNGDYCYTERKVNVGGDTNDDDDDDDDCNVSAGMISTDGPTSICIDGVSTPLNFSVTPGGIGSNRGWIITDDQRNILALPAAPPFDLEGAGVGTCLIYYIRYEDGLQGFSVGQNLGNLSGCFDLSNRIAIDRVSSGGPCENGGGNGDVNCDAVMASVSNGVIIVTGLNAERNTIEVQGPGTGYVPRLICRDDCGSTVEIPGLSAGEYTVKIQQSGNGDYCYTERKVFVNEVVAEQFVAWLGGSQEACPVISPAAGRVAAELRGNRLTISGDFRNLIGDFDRNIANGAHIHRAITGRNGGIEFILETRLESSQRSGHFRANENTFELTDDQVSALRNREFYINIHSTTFPGGELRGQLLPQVSELFQANLLGINEVPANNSEATGNVLLELRGHELIASGSFDNFTSEVATQLAGGGHIHRGFAGQNGDIELLSDLTLDDDRMGGIIDPNRNRFTLTNEQVHTLRQQGFYINIHSQANLPGEVRGQIAPFGSTYFIANLEGGQEVPPINVSSDGRIHVTFDGDRNISLSGSFNNLEGDLNRDLAGGVHLHLAPRGQNGDIIFLVETETNDERNGIFLPEKNTFRLSESQIRALFQEGIYLNVHSLVNVPGELRGQVVGQTIDACGNPNPNSSRNAPMLDLNAFRDAREIDLQWLTNTGYKNDYFVIEKSKDGVNFEAIQQLTNKDFSEEVSVFAIVDNNPQTGMNYYQVKQVHIDGTVEYSKVRTVEFNIDLDKVDVFPNPAQEVVSINLSAYQGKKGAITFYNQYGQMVRQLEVDEIPASPINVELSEFTNGTYHVFIQLDGGRRPLSKKLQIARNY